MQKVFCYRDIEIPIKSSEEAVFTVKFKTSGNYVNSYINVPGDNDFPFPNEGEVSLGRGSELKSESTIIASEILNFVKEIDNIAIDYFINGEKIVGYDKPKSEAERPLIIIHLKFTENE